MLGADLNNELHGLFTLCISVCGGACSILWDFYFVAGGYADELDTSGSETSFVCFCRDYVSTFLDWCEVYPVFCYCHLADVIA